MDSSGAVERRADIAGPRDFLYTMRVARRRFAAERLAGLAGTASFRRWARSTYSAQAAFGKLRDLVTP